MFANFEYFLMNTVEMFYAYLSNTTREGAMQYCNIVTAVVRSSGLMPKTITAMTITVQHRDLECNIAFMQQFKNSLNSNAE